MKERDETPATGGILGRLGFDPDAVLVKEPRVLLDPRFLGALHAELEEDLGPDEGQLTLLQIGFLHGLRDASRVVAESFDAGMTEDPQSPPLAIRFQQRRGQPGALELEGSWPDRNEASARLANLGTPEDVACFVSAGYTSGWFSGILDADILAIETTCSALGAEECGFVAREAEAWRESGDERALELLAAIPFGAFRELIRTELERASRDLDESSGLDSGSAVVHIWGPVMVMPFGGADEAQRAVELIGHDAGARDVSVVVLDLTGAIIDEAFGAAALERIVETVESRGVEIVFAGVSPLARIVVEDLEHPPVLTHKDVPSAIAAAFQIADAQRRCI